MVPWAIVLSLLSGLLVLTAVSMSAYSLAKVTTENSVGPKGADGAAGATTVITGPAGAAGREIVDPIAFKSVVTSPIIPKNITDVVFNNVSTYMFVTGSSGVVWTASNPNDPTTFVATQFGLPAFVSITMHSEFFYAIVSVAGSPCLWTSFDGSRWRQLNVSFSFAPTCIRSNGTLLVVVGGPVSLAAQVFTSPDGTTWTSRTSNAGNVTLNWLNVSAAGFVSVGTGGAVITSPDGITWTLRTSNTTNTLTRVTSTPSQFVAVGASGTIITTPAFATAWTVQTSRETVNYTSIGLVGSRLVAAGANVISTSTDGTIWTHQTTTGQFTAAGFGNGTYVLTHTGGGGGIMTGSSLNALTPRYSQSTSSSTVLTCVLYMPGVSRWVIGGNNGYLITSDDNGSTWTSRTSGFGSNTINGLILVGTTAIAFGNAGRVSTSTNGTSWTVITPITANDLLAGASNALLGVVLVGSSGTIIHSTDTGANWTARTSGTSSTLQSIACSTNGTFLVTVNVSTSSVLLSSIDAVAWTTLSGTIEANNATTTNMVVWDGTQFVLTAGSGTRQMVYVSTTGSTFQTVAAFPNSHTLFTYLPQAGTYVVGLYNFGLWSTATTPTLWRMNAPNLLTGTLTMVECGSTAILGNNAGYMTSTNGFAWNPYACTGACRSVASSDSTLLFADSSVGMFFRSADGRTFSPLYGVPEGVSGLSCDGTNFVAVCASGLYRSTDQGLTWTHVAPTPFLFYSFGGQPCIARSDSAFVAIGPTTVMSSPDGITWTLRQTMSMALTAVAWDKILQKFVTVDSGVVSLGNSTGVTWTGSWIRPMFAFNGTQLASNTNGTLLLMDGNTNTALVSMYKSTDGVVWDSVPTASSVYTSAAALSYVNGFWFLTGGTSAVEYADDFFKWFRKSLVANSTTLAVTYFKNQYVFAPLVTAAATTYHAFTYAT